MWILIIEITLTVSGISLTLNPKETRVAYADQYEDFFKSEISLTVSGIPLSTLETIRPLIGWTDFWLWAVF